MTDLQQTEASPFLTESRLDTTSEERLVANVPTLEELEKVHIRYVLERVRWHQGRAAAVLGISSKTLYRKIRQYGFKRPHVAPPDR
jgi:DNA-binding NtrC family response regulator